MSVFKKDDKNTWIKEADVPDKICHSSTIDELLNNISKLEELEKRLSYTLREVDLCINRG